jgi:FkbM family methyltransferase
LISQIAEPRGDILLTIGAATITLPHGHALPGYLKNFRNYDRFLPALAREMPSGVWVIDVGANCGDTLVAMIAANPSLNFLCLEADAHLFGYLERNIVQIRKAYPAVGEILPINALVGTAETSGVLTGEFGTKRVIASKEGQHATPLGIIASNVLSPNPPVSLIKVDVDGMDYDVLQSDAGSRMKSRNGNIWSYLNI